MRLIETGSKPEHVTQYVMYKNAAIARYSRLKGCDVLLATI